MPTKEEKYNEISSKRLKSLLAEEKITQKDLTKKIEEVTGSKVSQQHISQVIRGKVRLTEALAHDIAKVFPHKNLLYDWLMGEEDSPSITEKIVKNLQKTDFESNNLLLGLYCFLSSLDDYDIYLSPEKIPLYETVADDSNNTVIIQKNTHTIEEDVYFCRDLKEIGENLIQRENIIEKEYIIEHGEQAHTFPLYDMNMLLKQLLNVVEVFMKNYFEYPHSFYITKEGDVDKIPVV